MKRILLAVLCAASLLGGCTRSNIVNAQGEEETAADINWEKAGESAKTYFEDRSEFPDTVQFRVFMDQDEKQIQLLWVVKDAITPANVHGYAEAALKNFNDIVAEQDNTISVATDTTYGSLWDDYGISLGIIPDSTKQDRDTWYIDALYSAGSEIALPSEEEIAASMKTDTANMDSTFHYTLPSAEGMGPGAASQ